MATATIVKAWKDATHGQMAVSVAETQVIDGKNQQVNVEYIGSVPISELEGKTATQQKSLLVAAAKAERDRAVATATTLAMSGSVTI